MKLQNYAASVKELEYLWRKQHSAKAQMAGTPATIDSSAQLLRQCPQTKNVATEELDTSYELDNYQLKYLNFLP